MILFAHLYSYRANGWLGGFTFGYMGPLEEGIQLVFRRQFTAQISLLVLR
jgi:hypothetical protein